MKRTYFGLQDASGHAYGQIRYGSLRLWDSHTSWRDVETAPGVYDWSRIDAYVAEAAKHRVEVTLVIGGYTPACYGEPNSVPPTDAYQAYAKAVMERYKGRITTYQVWNEANITWFWTGTMEQMADLTYALHAVREAADPTVRLLSPSFAVRLPYERRMLADYLAHEQDALTPVWGCFDTLGLSLYPEADGGTPEDAMDLLTMVRGEMATAKMPSTFPVWTAEINYGVGSDPVALLPMRDQVAQVLRTYILGACYGIERMHWYRYDWNHVPGGWLGNTMLSDPDQGYTITEAGKAITTAQDWLKGGKPRLLIDEHGTYTVKVRHHGGYRLIYWNPTLATHIALPPKTVGVYNSRGQLSATKGTSPWATPRPKMAEVLS